MRKLIYLFFIAILGVSFSAQAAIAETIDGKIPAKETPLTAAQKEQRLQEINQRVEAIRAMDKSHLSREQRKELRQELRQMKKEAQAVTSGGVYLSVGAILLIILALIILL